MLYFIKDILKTLVLSIPYGLFIAAITTLGINKIFGGSFRHYTNLLNKKRFRMLFYTITYIFVLLYRTVFCRKSEYEPLEDVWGGWGIKIFEYTGLDYGTLIGNIIIFIPLTLIILATFNEVFSSKKDMLIKCGIFSLGLSLFIELLQLILKKGTFQISDIVYNTIGGLIGVGTYILIQTKIKGRRK